MFAIAITVLAALWAPAFAGASAAHHYDGAIDTGSDPVYPFGPCAVWDLDLDAQENVYVLCGGAQMLNNFASGAVVKKFDKNGNPVAFSATTPYLQGNTVIENPDPNAEASEGEYGNTFSNTGNIAVDATTGPTAGFIYILTNSRIEVLNPSGEFVAGLSVAGAFGIQAVATGADGSVYINSSFKIDRRDPSLAVIAQLYALKRQTNDDELNNSPGEVDLALDSTGAIWGVGHPEPGFGSSVVTRYEADQFGRPEQESTFAFGTHRKARRTTLAEAPLRAFGSEDALTANSISVDRTDDTLFVEQQEPRRILQFTRGTEGELSHQLAAPIGDSSTVGPDTINEQAKGIAVGSGGTIFAAQGQHFISKFAPGGELATVRDHEVPVADVGRTDATVRAEVELSGGSPITECEVVYGPTRAYGQSESCDPDPSGAAFESDTSVTSHLSGLTTGQPYHFAFTVGNADGTAYGIDRTFTPAAVLGVETEMPTDITDDSATFRGTLDPDGVPTTYHFEFGLSGDLTESTVESAPTTGTGVQQVSTAVTNLGTGKEYQYRLVATNEFGTTSGPVRTFQVAGPPTISGVQAANVRIEDADLKAKINPGGYPTTYQFEYGQTTSYGKVAPAEPGDAGASTESTDVVDHLAGLEPGRVYHFRVVATNQWGTRASADTTFNFLPEPCPNEHVRQQMKSSYLPDCRAYELVTPGNVEGAQIYPGSEALLQGTVGIPAWRGIAVAREIQNTGLANNPSRFAYYVGLGAIGGLEAPNMLLDQYTASRTNQGWATTFSGFRGSEAGFTGGHKMCSTTLDQCLDHTLPNPFTEGEAPNNWGQLFDVDGTKLGPAPTNYESVEGGMEFLGDLRPSPDFTHLAFSSRNVVFAEGGQTAAPGSAYDNDLRTGSVDLISLLRNGEPLPAAGDEGPFQFITIPPTGVSEDGSHILMETHAPDGPRRLYLRVDGMLTYEIAAGPEPGEGAGVKFIGMTSNGSRVLFLATQQLVAEDTDESADVYMWQENGEDPTLTLVSQGNGQGISDACNPSWTEACSVELLETEAGDRTGLTNSGLEYQDVVVAGTDSKLASSSGGVLFFSPETLAGSAPHNGKNLYLASNGEVDYIATLRGDQTIDRVQLSPDGEHVGFLTRAKLSGYDNEEFEEMYSFDADTGDLTCVSCLPSGEPPTTDVEASQNGPFMADDGRLFFATGDPLVPADADPLHIPDVYEYVDGRAQLISSGTSSNGMAYGGGGTFVAVPLGLESVSSNGRDVFFSTTDTLVPQDANGHYPKIYDARTGGGFGVPEEPAPCVAADECHGADSTPPAPPPIGTGSSITGGNHKPKKKGSKAKRRCNKKKKNKARCGRKGKHPKSKGQGSKKRNRGNR